MLGITIPATPDSEGWDEENNKFVSIKGSPETTLLLEHSLASISKWEEITEKPFLGKEEKSREDILLYIKCMCLSPYDDVLLSRLTQENYKEIDEYIGRKMTATIINEIPIARKTTEFVTAETMYYWMVSLQIPFECQYWHLNKLITLVKVVNIKNQPEKKQRPTRSSLAERRALNARRRAQAASRG